MKRLDPIHAFSAGGISVLTAQDQSAKIAELEMENAKLKRLLRVAANRIKQLDGREPLETTEIRGLLH